MFHAAEVLGSVLMSWSAEQPRLSVDEWKTMRARTLVKVSEKALLSAGRGGGARHADWRHQRALVIPSGEFSTRRNSVLVRM